MTKLTTVDIGYLFIVKRRDQIGEPLLISRQSVGRNHDQILARTFLASDIQRVTEGEVFAVYGYYLHRKLFDNLQSPVRRSRIYDNKFIIFIVLSLDGAKKVANLLFFVKCSDNDTSCGHNYRSICRPTSFFPLLPNLPAYRQCKFPHLSKSSLL